jgi:hypothetical protein
MRSAIVFSLGCVLQGCQPRCQLSMTRESYEGTQISAQARDFFVDFRGEPRHTHAVEQFDLTQQGPLPQFQR